MFPEMSLKSVECELVELAGHLAAGTCRFLQLLAEFDRRGGWAGPGLRSCSQWLGWRVGLSARTARDHLRVAHALVRLPETTAAFAAGRISYSKVRALTRIATPESERSLLTVALHGTTAHLEELVRATRGALDPRPADARRGLRTSRAADGSLLVRLRIPPERGEALLAAIDAVLDGPPTPPREHPPPGPACSELAAATAEHAPGAVQEPVAARRLDALLDLVTGATTASPPVLVVHLQADADGERTWVDGGPPLAPSTAARLTCTADVQGLAVDGRRHPLHLGRQRRRASRAQLLALRVRDGGCCVVPGCDARRNLEAHHVRWWSLGGRTDLDNLALVCGFHHRLVHEHGYRLTGSGGTFAFARPDGTPVPATGPPTHGSADDLRRRHVAQAIDGWTITPRWGGERLDLHHAVAALLPELRGAPVAA